jgi:2-keto-4-pentenoate hydratase/2-oxohepta-3-ene-1,7-dioic acid hydratase in catechol pathway
VKLATLKVGDDVRVVGVHGFASDVRYVDLKPSDADLPMCLKQIVGSQELLARTASAFATGIQKKLFMTGTLLAPIPRPGKVICIGLNYRDHARESGAEIPTEPVCFSKFTSAVNGPEMPIVLPAVAHKVDYEAELVVVIGQRGKNISPKDAHKHVGGYMNGHDVSARDWQLGRPGGQWLLGKTPDTFAPIGPWLVTADEVTDPHQLPIALRINGETMQNSSTREFIFGIDTLVSHLSQLITLEPGDLIFTGTPPGVGAARKPPVYLKPGDVVEVEIEGLGVLRNPVVAEKV